MGTSRFIQKIIDGKKYIYYKDLDIISDGTFRHTDPYNRTQVSAAVDLCLEVTTSCNMTCRNCFSNSSNDAVGTSVPFDRIRASIEDLRSKAIRVCVTGGEPMMHPEIRSILHLPEHFEDCGFVISTNGTFRRDTEELIVANEWLVAISLHGNKDRHNSYTKSNSFDCAVRRIRKLAPRTVVHIYTVLHKEITNRDLEWLFNLRDEAGATFLRLITPRPFGRYEDLCSDTVLDYARTMLDDKAGIKTNPSLTRFINVDLVQRCSS